MKKIVLNKVTAIFFIIISSFLLIEACSSSSSKFSVSQVSNEEWSDLVDKTVSERHSAEKVKQLGFQLLELANSATLDIEDLSAKSVALNENYKASKEDLQKLFDEFLEARKTSFTQYREIIFAMRSEVTEEEWKGLTK